MKMLLPYDKERMSVEIADQNFAGALVSKVESYRPDRSQQDLVEASLDQPIGSPKLEELVQGKKNIVIISSDHTRPVPSKIITPILLRRIRSAQPDAALLHPVNGFGPSDDQRFSTDFRQAYFSFHAPILTDGGVDFKLGRQYVPLGYETTMAPYRPMYSMAYAWIYSQNGATTGAIATIHVDPRLDVIGGVTLCVNSLFEFRGRAPCYIARGLYWLDSKKQTKLVGTFYTGPQPIAAAKGHIGKWQSEAELQLIHNVNRRLTLVSETNAGWDTRDPANTHQTSKWYGTYGMGIIHVHRQLDLNSRAEWFDDVDGSRIGTHGNYGEITVGPNFMPTRMINFRPEARWDVATNPVFGSAGTQNLKNHQWTGAIEMLVKF